MAFCDIYASSVECVIDVNNTLTYKIIVLSVLFIYSMLYIYFKEDNVSSDDMFCYFKDMLFKIGTYAYLVFLPLFLMTLRYTLTFEDFLLIIGIFYLVVGVVGLGLGLFFSWNKIKALVGKETRIKIKERYKYRNG